LRETTLLAANKNKQHRISSQRGTAIVAALFVVSLVAAAAIAMMARLNTDIQRTSLLLNANQAEQYAEGSVMWAIEQLTNNWQQKKPGQLIDKMPIQSKTEKIHGFEIISTITDMQGGVNINENNNKTLLMQLLKTVEPKLTPSAATEIATAIDDWIASGSNTDLFDNYYAKQTPPYHAAHQLMISTSELTLIKGITPALFLKLQPYVTALPPLTPININTATLPVLMSLSPSLTADAAKAIILHRQQTPFLTEQSFLSFDIVKNNRIPLEKITVTSNYFLVKTNVKINEQNITLYTLLNRYIKKSKPTVIILWQMKGTM
jgi:general secretion pathway protein K